MHKFILPLAASILSMSTLAAVAQALAPSPAPTDPAAASSPHQRDVTKKPGDEAATGGGTSPSDASTPSQKDAMKKHKPKKNKPADSNPSQ